MITNRKQVTLGTMTSPECHSIEVPIMRKSFSHNLEEYLFLGQFLVDTGRKVWCSLLGPCTSVSPGLSSNTDVPVPLGAVGTQLSQKAQVSLRRKASRARGEEDSCFLMMHLVTARRQFTATVFMHIKPLIYVLFWQHRLPHICMPYLQSVKLIC